MTTRRRRTLKRATLWATRRRSRRLGRYFSNSLPCSRRALRPAPPPRPRRAPHPKQKLDRRRLPEASALSEPPEPLSVAGWHRVGDREHESGDGDEKGGDAVHEHPPLGLPGAPTD